MSCFSCMFRPCISGASSRIAKPKRRNNRYYQVYEFDLPRDSTYPSREPLLSNVMDQRPFAQSFNEDEMDHLLSLEEIRNKKKIENEYGIGIGVLFDTEEEYKDKEVPEALCLICLDDLSVGEALNLNVCKCRFHTECLKEYVGEGVKTRAFPIKCPGSECLKEILQDDLHILLKSNTEEFNKYKKFYSKFLAESNPRKFMMCPDIKCQHGILIELGSLIKEINCPGCNQGYCMECKGPWHEELTCKQAKKLRKKNQKDLEQEQKNKEKQGKKEDQAFLKYSKDMQFKRCPKCGQVIEKIQGCNAVTCTRCKGMFCFYCGRKGDGHKCKHRPTCSMF